MAAKRETSANHVPRETIRMTGEALPRFTNLLPVVIAILSISTLTVAADGATLYVSPDGADTNSGAEGEPLATIPAAPGSTTWRASPPRSTAR